MVLFDSLPVYGFIVFTSGLCFYFSGVTSYYCERGMSKAVLEAGFKKYREERTKGKKDEL